MEKESLFAALDAALDGGTGGQLPYIDRLALSAWWLLERICAEFEISPSEAAAQVSMLAAVAEEMMES